MDGVRALLWEGLIVICAQSGQVPERTPRQKDYSSAWVPPKPELEEGEGASTHLVKIRKLFQAHTVMAIELLHEVPTYIKPRYAS